MTIRECYEAMGADFEDVAARLRKEERVQKFLLKFPKDPSYELLASSMEAGNMEEAFRAAHTLKGVCQNLFLTEIAKPVSRLSDLLKESREYSNEAAILFRQVKDAYEKTVEAIRQL